MQFSRDEDRLIELLCFGWDKGRNREDVAEIGELIDRLGPRGVEILLRFSSLHVELGRYVRATNVHERAMAAIRDSDYSLQSRANVQLMRYSPAKVVRVSLQLFPWAIAAVFFVLLVYPFLISSGPVDSPVVLGSQDSSKVKLQVGDQLVRPSQAVANVVRLDDAVWGQQASILVGENLLEQQRLELRSGLAQISMACGVDLVLQAPCALTLTAENHATLESGTLTAQAAEWATGFVVEAHDLQITDLGARFAISADTTGIVEAHVLEGQVLAEPMKTRRPRQSSMLLESGQAIRVDVVHASAELIEARRSDFVDYVASFRPLKPIAIWNTGIGQKVGGSDVHWQVVAGASENGPYPKAATIIEGVAGPYRDNRPESSQWISVTASSFPGVKPNSVHVFEMSFDLSGYELSTVYVVGNFLVDDTIRELRINGKPVAFENWETSWNHFDFQSFHAIEITDGFIPGENTISIDVYNNPTEPELESGPNPNPNPTGLRVEWQAFGSRSM